MKKGIIFDFDDTLVETTVHFEISRERFTSFMKSLDFPAAEVLETLDRNDIENVKKMGGYMKECFPQAMVQTYRHFCSRKGISGDPEKCKEVERIGWWVFEQRPDIVPGAIEVLESLRGDFHILLATKGDPTVQWQRIKDSGLKELFDDIFVLRDKTPEEYKKIAGSHGLDNSSSWIVGNSIKSEINPGLRAGFNCIYIPNRYTWHYENEDPIGEFVTLKSLRMIPRYLGKINMAV
ncbi:MAG: hypothetical protein JL50_15805 [Peptococcaceae bacterium BICA1-7]|nr:MAG: hypothetical protein JL50_15805 [Peptococcaceae bacterium BICA1-7]HBV96745.1 haloacid dehalogenase-like hydrolase [Desulfotomaculum sp.]